MSGDRRVEVVLPRRVAPQPGPALNSGGDCGPCCLAGALGLSGPQAVYDEFNDGKPLSISWGEMQRYLRVAEHRGLADRIIEHSPTWLGSDPSFSAWRGFIGWPAWLMSEPWFHFILMGVDAGYYALAEIDYSRTAGEAKGGADHWTLICGARTWTDWSPADASGCRSGKIIREVLVSCSASNQQGEWVDALDFLKFRGGFNSLLVRPAK